MKKKEYLVPSFFAVELDDAIMEGSIIVDINPDEELDDKDIDDDGDFELN